jgi:ADP-heptose:LPS heptosyltransferase
MDFYSLQKGLPAELELQELAATNGGGPTIINVTDRLLDFSDTAALIANLDLVISVDTAIAHLAGALAKPTWILNRFDACWRWLLDRSDSPWYPTARLYRQFRPGDWDGVLQQVAADLAKLP